MRDRSLGGGEQCRVGSGAGAEEGKRARDKNNNSGSDKRRARCNDQGGNDQGGKCPRGGHRGGH